MNCTLLLFVTFVVIKIYFIDCYKTTEVFPSGYTLDSDGFYELIKKERLKRKIPFNHHHQEPNNIKIITTTWKFIPADDVDKKKASDENLRTRKVWSRWSKWGECSVTCGEGTISRKRVCVLGRCAPGEMEEQRHPCSRAPCIQLDIEERREQD